MTEKKETASEGRSRTGDTGKHDGGTSGVQHNELAARAKFLRDNPVDAQFDDAKKAAQGK